MRTKNSFKIIITALFSNGISILINLVAQAFFIKILGSEYLGLNSLFSNVLSMLAIVELGIGSAIIYNLYKPIADKDFETIKSLMRFYKKSYHAIGFIVLSIGLIIIPIIPFLIKETNLPVNINFIYLLFLMDTVLSYFYSYKRSILYANQKSYIINIIHIVYLILLNVIQLTILFLTKNYYLYLIIRVIMRVVENVIITKVANKMYPFLLEGEVKDLDKKIVKDIFKKVRALFFHKIGGFIVFGTDNIIISKFLGLTQLGLYSNYNLVINGISTFSNHLISSTTASIGNLLVSESREKQFDVFKKIRFLNFWISSFVSVGILVVMESFIKIWIGSEYILTTSVLIILAINYYLNSTRSTYNAFKDAAGIYYEDRFIPIIESILNIILSVVLVKVYGLAGVFLGTMLSSLILWIYSYPKFIYKKIFQGSYLNYCFETLYYFVIYLIILYVSYFIGSMCFVENMMCNLLIKLTTAIIIPNLILIMIFYRTQEFKYYLNLILKAIKKIINK